MVCPVFLNGMARALIVRDKLEPVDIIVVLSGDNNGERVDEAVKLYKKGFARKILMSGGPLAWRLTAAEWMKKQALVLRVPSRAILLEDESESTLDNARFSRAILQRNGAKAVILVTSPTHSRRAKQVFEKTLKKDQIKVLSWPVQKSKFKLDQWWTRHEDTQAVMWEYVSLVYYFLKGY